MGARVSRQPAVEHRLDEIAVRLSHLMQADGNAYNTLSQRHDCLKPIGRPVAVSSALHVATEIPLEMAEQSAEAAALLEACSAGVKSRFDRMCKSD